jgi:UDP-GlcNAc:undecaprenyl-phosphate GlcNAc-1-phosphate transferase
MRTYFFLLLLSTVVSFVLTRWLARRAAESHWTRNEAGHGEDAGVPRLGGASVFVTALVMLFLLSLWDNQVTDRIAQVLPHALGLLGAATAVFLLGLYDDLRGAKPWQKLLVQATAASALYFVGFRIELLTNPFTQQPLELGWLSLPVTLLWLVAISNAFNLIDGLDGLAAGVGLFATLSLFLLAMLQSKSFVAAVAVALAGALLGFLPHNFNPARIYLGDSGSLTIGLVLAALSIEGSQKGPIFITLTIPLMIFGLPLLDVSVTTARRFLSGHPIFHRDEEHLHHRLLKIGLTPRTAVLILYGVAAVFAAASVLVVNFRGTVSPLVALLCGLLAWVVVRQMNYPEFAELDSHVRNEMRSQRHVLRNHILMRKLSSELEQAATLEESWQIVARVFESLELDGATLELHFAPFGMPRQFRWAPGSLDDWRDGGPSPDSLWTVALPLRTRGRAIGTLRLARALDRGHFMFRMAAVIEFFTGAFAVRVAEILDAAENERIPAVAGGR